MNNRLHSRCLKKFIQRTIVCICEQKKSKTIDNLFFMKKEQFETQLNCHLVNDGKSKKYFNMYKQILLTFS
jgi:hypothetical protein